MKLKKQKIGYWILQKGLLELVGEKLSQLLLGWISQIR